MSGLNLPLDEGMPQERTLLSWRRTAMTLGISGFTLTRLGMNVSPLLAGTLAFVASLSIVIITVSSLRRYAKHDPAQTGGKTTAMLSFSTMSLAVIEIAIVLME